MRIFCFLNLFLMISMSHGLIDNNKIDPKKNCSLYGVNSFCYTPYLLNDEGQIMSCKDLGTFALTFDDGPAPYTNQVLETLKKHDIKATFFVIGKKLPSNNELLQKITDDGHQIGLHTYTHSWLTNMSSETIRWEIEKWEETFTALNLQGVLSNQKIPNYMRAPHGAMNNQTVEIVYGEYGYVPVYWGIATLDTTVLKSDQDVINAYYRYFGGPQCKGILPKNITMITQQHDTVPFTVNSLDTILYHLKKCMNGTKFVTVAECMGNNPSAYRNNPRIMPSPPPQPSGSENINLSLGTFAITLISVIVFMTFF